MYIYIYIYVCVYIHIDIHIHTHTCRGTGTRQKAIACLRHAFKRDMCVSWLFGFDWHHYAPWFSSRPTGPWQVVHKTELLTERKLCGPFLLSGVMNTSVSPYHIVVVLQAHGLNHVRKGQVFARARVGGCLHKTNRFADEKC